MNQDDKINSMSKNANMAKNAEKSTKSATALAEEKILAFWNNNHIFEQSLANTAKKPEFVFYDGPPFATGLPHYGSLLSSIVKDLTGRYKTMRGFFVRRRWGWDCHGLPIENMIEKKLGLKNKKDIEKIGVAKFNNECKESVLQYTRDWKSIIERVGRWVEFDNAYKTMDVTYMESVWWALKNFYDNNTLYEGNKVLLYCPRCETPLAKAEIAMDNSYKDVTEESVTVRFKLEPQQKIDFIETDDKTYILAWTTTPWTLPANMALAVNKDVDYVLIDSTDYGGSKYILAQDRVVHNDVKGKILARFKGSELASKKYQPLFTIPVLKKNNQHIWRITTAEFVTTTDGTGIVHIAPVYGEDDFELGIKHNLPILPLLDGSGHFNDFAPEFLRGLYFKKAQSVIKDKLYTADLLHSLTKYTHTYPHCHRCDTALIYNAISSWFIKVSAFKDKMISLNQKINWVPSHLKNGRFLHTLTTAPDWTISRNRFWASPLPIWKCAKCDNIEVIGSVNELRQKSTPAKNTYIVMRHGEAESNIKNIVSGKKENPHKLTQNGVKQVEIATDTLKEQKIDLIIVSPFVRTQETAKIVAVKLGLKKNLVITDERLSEIDSGDYNLQPISEYRKLFNKPIDKFKIRPKNGENLSDVRKRVGELIYEVENKYKGKKILFITHEYPAWMMTAVADCLDSAGAIALRLGGVKNDEDFIKTAEHRELNFKPMPYNNDYELDLHRPYIDKINLICKCGDKMTRVSEVVDGWFESGAMPFAEYHYPFENKTEFEWRFPGDYVAEYIAQTRTWFYYMHVIAVALFSNISFKNVVTTGTILAKDGSKMSKSKQNYTDPAVIIDQYGSDALRYYLMTSVVMLAEDVRFSDEDLREVYNRVVNLIRNSFVFYKTYAHELLPATNYAESTHPLDVWILARLANLTNTITTELDNYDTVRAGRPIRDFIADLSQWYIRRSRDRFKGSDETDKQFALSVTHYVFLQLSKLIAPFMPFVADEIYRSIMGEDNKTSVHLEQWPKAQKRDDKTDNALIAVMEEVRKFVSYGLEARSTAQVRVRQPLAKLTLNNATDVLKNNTDLHELIKDEVNVKNIAFAEKTSELKDEVLLDVAITPELKKEGNLRELLRKIQDLRKQEGFTPSDTGTLVIICASEVRDFIEEFAGDIKTKTLLNKIEYGKYPLVGDELHSGKKITIDDLEFEIFLQK